MWDERTHRGRREVAALAADGLGVRELYTRAMAVVHAVVPVELTCWMVLDPESTVISAVVNGPSAIPGEYEPRLADAEYAPGEPHTFAELAHRRATVSVSSDLDAAAQARSRRLNSVWRPLGLTEELRVLFTTADGTAWGGAGMVRAQGSFSAREIAYLTEIAPALGSATRLAVRAEVGIRRASAGPAVVVLDHDGVVRSCSAGARAWRARFDELAPGRFEAVLQLMFTGMTSAGSHAFEARLRDGAGSWALLRATPLIGDTADGVAVTIDPADAAELLGPLMRSFGLTGREREICGHVLAGLSTEAIARVMFLSRYTVQDHLKSVFEKAGVHSRRELVSRLRSDAAEPFG